MAANPGYRADRQAAHARSVRHVWRALLVLLVTFVLGVLLGAALPAGSRGPAPAAPERARPVAVTSTVEPAGEAATTGHGHRFVANVLISAGTTGLVVSAAGMVIVARWRRRW